MIADRNDTQIDALTRNTPMWYGEWALSTNFNATDDFMCKWADAQKLKYSEGYGWLVCHSSYLDHYPLDSHSSKCQTKQTLTFLLIHTWTVLELQAGGHESFSTSMVKAEFSFVLLKRKLIALNGGFF
jgi:hypothetical protein